MTVMSPGDAGLEPWGCGDHRIQHQRHERRRDHPRHPKAWIRFTPVDDPLLIPLLHGTPPPLHPAI